jgi:hypothetical protein
MGFMLDRPLFFPHNGQAMLYGADPSSQTARLLARHSTDDKTVLAQLEELLYFNVPTEDATPA